MILILPMIAPGVANASQPSAAFPHAYLVVTFDDGRTGALTYAAPVLQSDRIKATMFTYVTSLTSGWNGFLQTSGMMSLQRDYRWDIQGHTYSHPNLDKLTPSVLQSEIVASKQELLKTGFQPISIFAYPYGTGSNNATVIELVKQNYVAARNAFESNSTPAIYGKDIQFSSWCIDGCPLPNNYQFGGNVLLNSTAEATGEAWIDKAVSNHMILILVFHQIVNNNPDRYSYTSQDFTQLMTHAKTLIDQGTFESLYMSEAVQLLYPSSGLFSLNNVLLFSAVAVSTGLIVAFLATRYRRRRSNPCP